MTTLVIEDGTGVQGANSYTSLVEARTIAASLGRELPADEQDANVALILGAQYTEKFRNEYQGKKLTATQGLQFPRSPVSVDGFNLQPNDIPNILKTAQVLLGCEAGLGVELMPTNDGAAVQKERVEGAVEVQYFQSDSVGESGSQPYFTEAMSYLEPLFNSALSDSSGSAGWLFGVRS